MSAFRCSLRNDFPSPTFLLTVKGREERMSEANSKEKESKDVRRAGLTEVFPIRQIHEEWHNDSEEHNDNENEHRDEKMIPV